MDFLGLTTTEQIRGVLTTSPSNLPDATIASFGLEDDLTVMLDGSVPDWQVVQTAGSEGQQRLLRLIAKYFCAQQLALTATLWVLKKETDGSNEGQRSDKEGYTYLATVFGAKVIKYLGLILDDLGIVQPTPAPMVFMSRLVPGRDPITQPRTTDVS